MAPDDDLITTDDNGGESPAAVLARLALPLVEDLPNPIPLSELIKDSIYELIQRMVSDVLRCNTIPDAMELLTRARLYKQLNKSEPILFDKYRTIVLILKFVTLAYRKEAEIIKLFSENLVFAFQHGIDVAQKIQDRIEIDTYPYDEISLLRSLIFTLENSQETIGRNRLVMSGDARALEPTVSNWLKDFQVLSRNTSGGVGRALYLSRSTNLKALQKDDQDVVLAIVSLYDYLREQVSRLMAETPDPNMVKAERFGLPENIKLEELLNRQRQEDMASSVIPEIEPRPTRIMPDIIVPQAKPSRFPTELTEPMPPIQQPYLLKPLNAGPGISLGRQNLGSGLAAQPVQTSDIRQIRREIEEKKQEAQRQIDKKLEELKKKKERPESTN
jgi:hypothetical protein